MSRAELDIVHEKLDRLLEIGVESKTKISDIEQHLCKLNSKVATHEKQFTEVYNDFNKTLREEKDNRVSNEKITDEKINNLKTQLVALIVFVSSGAGIGVNLLLKIVGM